MLTILQAPQIRVNLLLIGELLNGRVVEVVVSTVGSYCIRPLLISEEVASAQGDMQDVE